MVATSPPGFVAGRYGKEQMSCVTRKTTIFYHTAIANGKRGISSPAALNDECEGWGRVTSEE